MNHCSARTTELPPPVLVDKWYPLAKRGRRSRVVGDIRLRVSCQMHCAVTENSCSELFQDWLLLNEHSEQVVAIDAFARSTTATTATTAATATATALSIHPHSHTHSPAHSHLDPNSDAHRKSASASSDSTLLDPPQSALHSPTGWRQRSPPCEDLMRPRTPPPVLAEVAHKVCELCGAIGSLLDLLQLTCEHVFCLSCLAVYTKELVTQDLSREMVCPVRSCDTALPEWILKLILSTTEFEDYMDASLQLAIDNSDRMFRCPNTSCAAVMERVELEARELSLSLSQSRSLVPLPIEAAKHREQFRMRCRNCQTVFCSSCMAIPYHHGFTCEGYLRDLNSRRCRFCETQLPELDHKAAKLNEPRAFRDICSQEECQAKRKQICPVTLPCGHCCVGVSGEEEHPSCLVKRCPANATNYTVDDFCGICGVDSLSSAPCIVSKCGHIFHYHCVLRFIRGGWGTTAITFKFAKCPLCNEWFDNPALTDELKDTKKLFSRIESMAAQRLIYEGMEKHEMITDPSKPFYQRPTDFAVYQFLYYMCFQCKQPYFAGQRDCDNGEEGRVQREDMVCGGCSGDLAPGTKCEKHAPEYLQWKCQFCCQLASWYCWGKTHFCNSCHLRQQRGDYVSKYPVEKLPQCVKASCPLKGEHPPNGFPFLVGCILCRGEATF